jgi:serine/threonine-protein kinase RsbW
VAVADLEQTYPVSRAVLAELRERVAGFGRSSGLEEARLADLILIVNELTSNVVRHGGGVGGLRLWRDSAAVWCEVSDTGGGIQTPWLAGRQRTAVEAVTGRGLWIIRQLADQVRIDSDPRGTTVTVTMYLP